METIETTYQQANEFFSVARNYLQIHPEDNKLRYALTRTIKSASRLLGEYQDAVEEVNINNCLAADDGKGAILRDARGEYQFTKEGALNRKAQIGELFRKKVSLNVHFATELPKDLSLSDRDAFQGFVIRENDVVESKLEVVN